MKGPQEVRQGVCPLSTRDMVGVLLNLSEALNGIEFYAYQRALAYRIIESLLLNDGAVITGLFSRQSGKSETVASVAVGLCIFLPKLADQFPSDERLASFRGGVWIGVFAPKQDLSGPIYEKVRQRAECDRGRAIMSDPEVNVGLTQSRGDCMAFTNGSLVRASTASEQTTQEGKTYHLVLLDEAQRISRSKTDKEIAPMLAATNGTMVKIGTAWMSRGGFHNDIQMNIHEEERGGPRNHYQFDYEQVITEKRALYDRHKREFEKARRKEPPDSFHLRYEKWVETQLARLGGNKDSEEFKMNFRLLWQESRQIAIKEHVFAELALPSVEVNVPKRWGYQYAGLDIAKNYDSTVLTVVEVDRQAPIVDVAAQRTRDGDPVLYYNRYVVGWLELQGSFEEIQYRAICEFMKDFNVVYMLADSTGMGDPIVERLQVLLSPFGVQVEPFRFTAPSKSDIYKFYLQEIEARRFRYPAGEVTRQSLMYQRFVEQHLALEREWNGSYLACQAPDGEHDDYPDSAALGLWASRQQVMPTIEMDDGGFIYGRQSSRPVIGSDTVQGRAARYVRGRGWR